MYDVCCILYECMCIFLYMCTRHAYMYIYIYINTIVISIVPYNVGPTCVRHCLYKTWSVILCNECHCTCPL